MKLRCIDGIVRDFRPSKTSVVSGRSTETVCNECGFEFGVSSWNVIKAKLVNHICKNKEIV